VAVHGGMLHALRGLKPSPINGSRDIDRNVDAKVLSRLGLHT
jgi:hypothetical protein